MEIAYRFKNVIRYILPNKLLRWQGKRKCYRMIMNDMETMTDDEKGKYIEQLKGLLTLLD